MAQESIRVTDECKKAINALKGYTRYLDKKIDDYKELYMMDFAILDEINTEAGDVCGDSFAAYLENEEKMRKERIKECLMSQDYSNSHGFASITNCIDSANIKYIGYKMMDLLGKFRSDMLHMKIGEKQVESLLSELQMEEKELSGNEPEKREEAYRGLFL